MAVFVTFLGVRPSVVVNATLVRSSPYFHKSCFVMWLNFCESMGKRRQPEGYFFFDGPRPPEIAFLSVNFQLFLSAAHRIRPTNSFNLSFTSRSARSTCAGWNEGAVNELAVETAVLLSVPALPQTMP